MDSVRRTSYMVSLIGYDSESEGFSAKECEVDLESGSGIPIMKVRRFSIRINRQHE